MCLATEQKLQKVAQIAHDFFKNYSRLTELAQKANDFRKDAILKELEKAIDESVNSKIKVPRRF